MSSQYGGGLVCLHMHKAGYLAAMRGFSMNGALVRLKCNGLIGSTTAEDCSSTPTHPHLRHTQFIEAVSNLYADVIEPASPPDGGAGASRTWINRSS